MRDCRPHFAKPLKSLHLPVTNEPGCDRAHKGTLNFYTSDRSTFERRCQDRTGHRTMRGQPPFGGGPAGTPAYPIHEGVQMKHFLRPTLTAAALAVALGLTAGAQAQTSSAAATGTVDKAKASQLLGYQMASQVPGPMRELVDPATVGQAVTA